ncbi:MAG: DUF2974 domain-containing protein [Clostridia bacterium]|nr:DUF2974 domain-containing protein [Clostridia bacterium]
MLDYLKTYGHVPFSVSPLNDVDLLIFAQLSYMDFSSVEDAVCPFSQALAHASAADSPDPSEDRFSFQRRDDRNLAALAAVSARYEGVRFAGFTRHFDPAAETQFAALSLLLSDAHLLVAFRGTDNTLAGWKEDFNMAFMDEIPAQRMALDYLTAADRENIKTITVCGHSKGGNLALYAASACSCNMQDRIDRAVSFDGPGLNEHVIRSDGYRRIEPRMHVVLPRDSLVGRLFEQPGDVRIIDSRSFSTLQHYPYFWKTGKMDFIGLARPGRMSVLLGKTVCGLMEKLDSAARERLVEVVYGIIASSDVDTFNEMIAQGLKSASAVAGSLFRTDAETRRLFLSAVTAILSSAAEALGLKDGQEPENPV